MRAWSARAQAVVAAARARITADAATIGVVGAIAVLALVGYVVDPAAVVRGIDAGPALPVGLSLLATAAALVFAPSALRARVVAVLLVVAAAGSTQIAVSGLSGRPQVDGVRATVETLVARPDVPADAQFYVVSRVYDPGTRIRIRPQQGDAIEVTLGPGQTRFAMVDLEPGRLLAHPVLYAVVSADGTRVLTTWTHEWFAKIDAVPYWSVEEVTEVGGRGVALLAPPSAAVLDVDGWSRTVAGVVRDLTRGSVAAAAVKKKAVLIDGGDKWIEVPPAGPTMTGSLGLLQQAERRAQLIRMFDQIDVRRAINRQANQLAESLTARGYDVTRLSGFGVDPNPAPTADRIRAAIADAAKGAGSDGELFVHFIAHGSKQGLALHDKACDVGGSADCFALQPLRYADLAGMLDGLDPALKKLVAINACYSGAAVEALSKVPGLELHTAASADGKTSAGLDPKHPSWTQTLLEKLRAELGDDALAAALKQVAAARAGDGARITEAVQQLLALLPSPTPTPTPAASPTPTPTPVPVARATLRVVATFAITGLVVDSVTGQAVSGAQVTAFPVSGSFASAATATTDGGGAFSFRLPAGSYRLRVTSVFAAFPAQDWSGTLTVERDRAVVVPILRPST